MFLRETTSDAQRDRLHYFNSFFYKQIGPDHDFEKVRRWTKAVDLFQKDFIVVPINDRCGLDAVLYGRVFLAGFPLAACLQLTVHQVLRWRL